MIKIKVKAVGFYKKYFPKSQFELEIEEGAKVIDALNKLNLQKALPYICLVNENYVKQENALSDGDELTIVPILGGG